MNQSRRVTRVIRGQATSDGAGVKLLRIIGTSQLPALDPFLMLDEFRSDQAGDYIAGFPDHPHRGFETVTYMLAGKMRHHDNQGNSGLLEAGSVQWMTAGRGIVHSEMPEQENGLMWGFQLWVNLPARDKMMAPRYQDIPPSAVPEVAIAGGTVRVLAGSLGGVTGPVQGIVTEPLYLDVRLQGGAEFGTAVAAGHHAFAYVYQGAVEIGGRLLQRGELAVLEEGVRVDAVVGAEASAFILVAASPLHEPVARYGPFVMNTQEEIHQAFADYRAGRF